MKVESAPAVKAPTATLRSAVAVRAADYLALLKPRIAALAMATVTVGYVLGAGDAWSGATLATALLGIGLVAASTGALNQFVERETDRLMPRTADRPLPSGRLAPAEVLGLGLLCGVAGLALLTLRVNALTGALAALVMASYVLVYTPLKRHTSLCTAVGAVPGALPPVLGYTAACGRFDAGAVALFSILYLWQFPHFLAIGWLYRKEYAGAGLRMIPGAAAPELRVVGLSALAYALALVPVSMLPARVGLAGDAFVLAALVLGLAYVACAFDFLFGRTREAARRLLYGSLLYLPLLLFALVWDHLRLLQ